MNIGISPITGTIFAGKSRKSKNGDYYEWVGKHTDVTNEAIRAVYEWMMFNAKKDNSAEYSISYTGHGKLTYIPEDVLIKRNAEQAVNNGAS